MAETDVRDLSKQPTLSKYQPYLTYGLLAFIGGFAGLHTLYRTGKVSFFRTVLSGCFLYLLVSYNYWYLYALLVLINSFITLSIVFNKNVTVQNIQRDAVQAQDAESNDKLILITIFIGLEALLINAAGIKISFK